MNNDVTEMLGLLSKGNKDVVNDIFPLIYAELKKLAGSYPAQRARQSHFAADGARSRSVYQAR
jgi:hypothetical protein